MRPAHVSPGAGARRQTAITPTSDLLPAVLRSTPGEVVPASLYDVVAAWAPTIDDPEMLDNGRRVCEAYERMSKDRAGRILAERATRLLEIYFGAALPAPNPVGRPPANSYHGKDYDHGLNPKIEAEFRRLAANAGTARRLVDEGVDEHWSRRKLLRRLEKALHKPHHEADEADPQDVIKASEAIDAESGMRWLLSLDGNHYGFLVCGDAMDPYAVAQAIDSDDDYGAAVDMILTDPPYGIGIGASIGISTAGARASVTAPLLGDQDTDAAKAGALFYVMTEAGHRIPQVWWGINYYPHGLYETPGRFIWDKKNDGTPYADAEIAWTNIIDTVRIWRHRWMGYMKDSEHGVERIHATQKPVELYRWCIAQAGLEPGSLILDPFAGSGSLALAVAGDGYRCALIEKDPACCAAIVRRLRGLGFEVSEA